MWELGLLLLPVAAASGWAIGKKSLTMNGMRSAPSLGSDYYKGLNYLINEQPDKALDAFIRMLDASPDTVETTMALGNFFRRRGEVDKAIRIHQNLIAKPNLTQKQRSQSLLELAQDYMRAGMYDRAENLFIELIDTLGPHLEISLRHLIDIYEREKDWAKAIRMAKRLQEVAQVYKGKEIAHYFCELAEIAWGQGKIRPALKSLKQACAYDRESVRASLLLGKIEHAEQHYEHAIRAYKQVQYQDPEFISEVIVPIQQCYEKLNSNVEMLGYFEHLIDTCRHISVVLASAEHHKKSKGDREAAVFLAEQMKELPSIRGIRHLVDYHLEDARDRVREELLLLRVLMDKLIENSPTYRCSHCGFSAKTMHWLCPSCRKWSVIKPVHRIDGEF